jgi:hypothetical protein
MRVPCPGSVSCSATSNEMRLRSIAPSQRFLSIGIQRPAPLIKTHRLVQAVLIKSPCLLRTTQALAEESCIQSALYASTPRNKTALNAVFGRLPVKNYSN